MTQTMRQNLQSSLMMLRCQKMRLKLTLKLWMTTLAMHGGKIGQPLQEGVAFLHVPCALAAFCATSFIAYSALQSVCTEIWLPIFSSAVATICRRAAHFAHFGADDEAEEGDNLHTGGTEV